MVACGDQVGDVLACDAESLFQEADDHVRSRAHRVEDVAGVDYQVHIPLQDGVYSPPVSLLDVDLTLIPARLLVELRVPRVPQVRIRDVSDPYDLIPPRASPYSTHRCEILSERQKSRILPRVKALYGYKALAKYIGCFSYRTVALADPDHLRRGSKQQTTLMEVRVFGDDSVSVLASVVPYLSIARCVHAEIVDVGTFWVHVGQPSDQTRGEVLVEEQPQKEGSATNLRSMSAAKARLARISSASRKGKSARIAS